MMMSAADPPCPFLSKPFLHEKQIERTCSEALAAQGLMPDDPGPVRIDRFIEKQFGIDIEYDDLHHRFGEGVMGACRFERDGSVAQILVELKLDEDESKLGEKRVRSTMAHEAGHGLLHGSLFAEKFAAETDIARSGLEGVPRTEGVISDGFACRGLGSQEKGRRRYDWWEVQANMAMASLLLPRQLVDEFVRDAMSFRPKFPWGGRAPAPLLNEVAGMVADTFNVSITMAEYRIQKLYDEISSQPDLL